MKYLDINQVDLGSETGEDAQVSTDALEAQLHATQERIKRLPEDANYESRTELELQIAAKLIGLERGTEAWDVAYSAFQTHIKECNWEQAVEACELLFRSDQPDSLVALGHGVWLSVTYPIDAELTLAQLQHVIDETPDDSDGAAVAAATAVYIVDLRTQGKRHNDSSFLSMQMLGSVARRHSDIQTQQQFDTWLDRLELNQPNKFLVRLRNVIDVMVQDNWWIDRDSLQAELPIN